MLSQVARRVVRLLRRRGRLDENVGPADALEALKGMSVQTRLPLPPGAREWMPPRKARCASLDGFSLHANVLIHGNDRQGLEQLCLYGARGAISLERLEQRQDGSLAPNASAPDGSTHLVLTPIALAVGDFNGDGALDLAVANHPEPPSGDVGVLINNTPR